MGVNSPGRQEEDPETATCTKRRDGVREAGWGEAGRIGQGWVRSRLGG